MIRVGSILSLASFAVAVIALLTGCIALWAFTLYGNPMMLALAGANWGMSAAMLGLAVLNRA